MPRLSKGDNFKIDIINNLVDNALSDDKDISKESLSILLRIFNPLMLKLCKKWSVYFNDDKHQIKSFDEILSDARYWFVHYTLFVYQVNGAATYNKFIKDHIDQRVRYIFESELRYRNKNIFPDAYTSDDGDSDDSDTFDMVVNNYTNGIENDIETNFMDNIEDSSKHNLVTHIFNIINTDIFNERERDIFKKIVYEGSTHEDVSRTYGISRTRITQILAKTKAKLYKQLEGNQKTWDLLDESNIEITNPKF